MSEIKIIHNPRCSKSRETLKLLQEKNLDVSIIEYLKVPLTLTELKEIYHQLEIDSVIGMMRTKEADYKTAELHADNVTDEQRFAAMVKYPKLIERPIVIKGSKAKIGRPPEAVLDIL